jgi:excisionase family DNA binding protein
MKLMNAGELARYLRLSKSSIYKKVMRREIPFIKATGVLLFNTDEIDLWLKNHAYDGAGSETSISNILKQKSHGKSKD